jgi:hypothetical protein
MDKTPNLQLSLMANKQGQRSTFHDDALKALDTLVMLSVIDRDLSSPPVSPDEGDRYLVKAPGSGHAAWADDHIVVFLDGDWLPHEPRLGWTCYVQDEGVLLAWDGSSWEPAIDVLGTVSELQNLARLGLGTTADATNPLAAILNNALFAAKTVAAGGDGHLRYKLSKESAAKTLSFLFQDNFSGRAEIGLTGDDDFHFKVSADGSSWLEALTVDRSTGKLTIGQGFADPVAARGKLYAAPLDAMAFNGVQLNGGVDVSQELGTTGATLASGTAKYTADLWQAKYVHGAGTAVVTSGQVAAGSFPAALPGYSFGHQIKATTALGSPANGDYAMHRHLVEGYRVARLAWGTSGAQPLTYGFNFYATISGTIFVKIGNSDNSRNHYVEHAVVSGWNWIAGSVAGDTSGTWQKTTSVGLIFDIYSAGKAASPVVPGSWTSTNTMQTTNSTSLLGSNNNLTIVTGLILLPGLELPSSSHAALIMRPFDQEVLSCQRYLWEKVPNSNNYFDIGAIFSSTSARLYFHPHRDLRVAPSLITSGTASDYNFGTIDAAPAACDATPSLVGGGVSMNLVSFSKSSGHGFAINAFAHCGRATANGRLLFDARL